MAFLRPSSDVSDGLWTTDSGATSLYEALDETSQSDADYVRSGLDPVDDSFEVHLENPASVLGSGTLKFTVGKQYDNDTVIDVTVALMQGATEIASWDYTDVVYGFTLKTETLTGPQLAAITDWDDLRLRVTANIGSAGDVTLVLDLDFTVGTLDSRVTFSRTTHATHYGSDGLVRYAPNNLLPYSQDFTQAQWIKGPQAALGALVTAPDGTLTGQTVTLSSGAGPYIYRSFAGGTFDNASRHTLSLWAKKSAAGGATHFRFSSNNGVAVGTGVYQKNTLTNDWQRFSLSSTAFSNASSMHLSIISATDALDVLDTDCLGSIDIWGAQLEKYNPSASAYVPTASSVPVYGPRFDHDPVTLEPRGLLIEEQRTNVVPHSEDLTNAAWTNFNTGDGSTSRTADVAIAPDGNTTADLVTMNRTTSTADWAIVQASSGSISGTATVSIYLKAFAAGDIGRQVAVSLHDGSAFVAVTNAILTADWKRFLATGAVAGTANFIIGYVPSTFSGPTINGETKFYAWGAQAEAGAFATSYIPTTTAAVTRAADNAMMMGTGFSSWFNQPAGTFVLAADMINGNDPFVTLFQVDSGDNYMRYGHFKWSGGPGAVIYVDAAGVNQAWLNAIGDVPQDGTPFKTAFSYAVNDLAISLDGGAVAADTTLTLPTSLTQITLGNNGSANYLTGHIASLQFYNVAKSDTELQALTA